MPDKFRMTSNRITNPAWIISFFILLSLAVLIFHIPEKITAALGLCFFFLLAVRHPVNGINFTILSIPFFLGAAHKPYFSLFEILIYGTLILGFFRLRHEKRAIEIPFRSLVLLFFLAALFSIPINAKEYYWEFWATPLKGVWFQWMRGHEKFPLIHLRALSNLLSGILIFILAANLFSNNTQEDWKKFFKNMVWLAVLICVLGILFLFNIIPFQPKTYLSLSLAGTHEGAISALAFNRQYLAQYLILIAPLVFYFLYCYRRNLPSLVLYGLILSLFIFSLSASMQRSAFLVFFLQIILLLGFQAIYISKDKKKMLYFFLIPFLLLTVMILVDLLFLEKRFLSRIMLLGFSEPDQRRLHLWKTAWNMFRHSPFLGVGLGKFYEFFPEFYSDLQVGWKTFGLFRGESHSFFFQTLAEQGAFGLLLILALVVAVIIRVMKKAGQEPVAEHKWLLGVLIVSLISWFLLGFFHNVAYVRSLGIFFWILLGCAVALTALNKGSANTRLKTKPPFSARDLALPKHGNRLVRSGICFRNRFFFFALVVLIAALGYQIKLIHDRPLNPFFHAGFYEIELLPGGEKIRWIGKRAVVNLDIEKDGEVIWVSAPLPGIADHPQKILLSAEKERHEFLLKDAGWQAIPLPIPKHFRGPVLLKIETTYAFNPKKSKLSDDDRDLGVRIREN